MALRSAPDFTLGVASLTGQDYAPYRPFTSHGTTYYGVGAGDQSNGLERVANRWRGLFRADNDLDSARTAIADFKPTLIHVHGTENVFGLLCGQTPVPVVISIQGILSVCEIMDPRGRDSSLFLSLSPSQFARGTGMLLDRLTLKRLAERERVIMRRCRHFIGRTRWDSDVVRSLSPEARYYHCDEPLRPVFFESEWQLELSEPQTVYCTMGGYARKGLGTLLRAIALLHKGPAPEIRLRFAGQPLDDSEGGRAAAREIRRLGLSPCVTSLGRVGPDSLASELRRARVFALPTHIDNGSNSLSEAMAVGVPCVASAAGGVPTTARDEVDALLVQDGDPYALAGAILRLLEDDALARRLSKNARMTALKRHDPAVIRETMLAIYRHVIEETSQISVSATSA